MKVLILTHYPLSGGPSMRAYPRLIAEGLTQRGHQVQLLTAPVLLGQLPVPRGIQKWLGYLDQFLLFPILLNRHLNQLPQETLIVVSDQALGPWVPWLRHRPHVIHCHDFLALQRALGEIPHHQLSWSGQLYQRFIRWGFRQGQAFISVSDTTRQHLHHYLKESPLFSEVALNPLRGRFYPLPDSEAKTILQAVCPSLVGQTYLFHIGRNWYKNRLGVLHIWEQLHRGTPALKLVMVGALESQLAQWLEARPHLAASLTVLSQVSDQELQALYSQAAALLFPSHAEGFGWPILEAMACGCLVITTAAGPMNEVGGEVPCYLPRCHLNDEENWARECACRIQQWLNRGAKQHSQSRRDGLARIQTFRTDAWIDKLEALYQQVLQGQENSTEISTTDRSAETDQTAAATEPQHSIRTIPG